jgi:phosphatidylserine/phosphatidylglycerophosphate/cardiolipin synthase-like enzyme
MKKFLQILFFSSTLALLGGGDPAKFNNYSKDQTRAAAKKRSIDAAQWEEIHEIEAQATAEKRSRDTAEQEKMDREYADALEAEKSVEREILSKKAAEEKSRIRKLLWPDRDKSSHSQALFTGQDAIEKRLIELIGKENKSIKGAINIFSNKKIAEAIVDRIKKENISVNLLIDSYVGTNQEDTTKNCLRIFKNGGATVSVSLKKGKKGKKYYVMHHKFLIFENNNGEQLLLTGSYNFSVNANTNAENVIITNDRGLIKSFSDEFDRLMEQNKATTETQISS